MAGCLGKSPAVFEHIDEDLDGVELVAEVGRDAGRHGVVDLVQPLGGGRGFRYRSSGVGWHGEAK
jgi:hypothetical protein